MTHIKMSVFQIYNNNNKYMTSWHKTTTTATFLVNTYRHKTTTPDLYLLNTRQTQDYKTTTLTNIRILTHYKTLHFYKTKVKVNSRHYQHCLKHSQTVHSEGWPSIGKRSLWCWKKKINTNKPINSKYHM